MLIMLLLLLYQEMNIVSLLLASCEADVVFGHMVEMAILVTRLVVEFAKHLPGFQMITKDDQITLLKAIIPLPVLDFFTPTLIIHVDIN